MLTSFPSQKHSLFRHKDFVTQVVHLTPPGKKRSSSSSGLQWYIGILLLMTIVFIFSETLFSGTTQAISTLHKNSENASTVVVSPTNESYKTDIPSVSSNFSTKPAILVNKAQEPATRTSVSPSWVTKAQSYVRISNYTASIDPAIKFHLTPQEINQVNIAVVKYNTISIAEKEPQATTTSSLAVIQSVSQKQPTINLLSSKAVTSSQVSQAVPHGCQMVMSSTSEWWGQQFYFNDCAVQTIVWTLGVGAGISGLIAIACPACMPVATVISAFLAVYAGTLTYEDYYCGGQGAYLELSWAAFLWFAALC